MRGGNAKRGNENDDDAVDEVLDEVVNVVMCRPHNNEMSGLDRRNLQF